MLKGSQQDHGEPCLVNIITVTVRRSDCISLDMKNSNRNFKKVSVRSMANVILQHVQEIFFKVMGMPEQDKAKIDLKLKQPGL